MTQLLHHMNSPHSKKKASPQNVWQKYWNYCREINSPFFFQTVPPLLADVVSPACFPPFLVLEENKKISTASMQQDAADARKGNNKRKLKLSQTSSDLKKAKTEEPSNQDEMICAFCPDAGAALGFGPLIAFNIEDRKAHTSERLWVHEQCLHYASRHKNETDLDLVIRTVRYDIALVCSLIMLKHSVRYKMVNMCLCCTPHTHNIC